MIKLKRDTRFITKLCSLYLSIHEFDDDDEFTSK